MTDYRAVVGSGIAWTAILLPLAIVAMVFVLPNLLTILGWGCDMLRWVGESLRG